MKKMYALALVLACVLLLGGCSACEHEWTEADCVNPAVCAECGETEGEALGHAWNEATCTTVRTCSRCGRTEGDPLGHAWIEANCTDAKTCAACGEVVGEALGHTWVNATTEAPKTCSVCGEEDGEKIQTDPRFVTANAQPLFGRWESEVNWTEEDLKVEHFNGSLEGIYWVEFGETGMMKSGFKLTNEEAFRKAMAEYYADWVFQALEEEGVDEEEANAAAKVLLEKTVEEYILSTQAEQSTDSLIEELLSETSFGSGWSGEFVYYVEGDQLYVDEEWKEDMHSGPYEFIGTTLMLYEFIECKAVESAE